MSCELTLTATLEGISKFLFIENSGTVNKSDGTRKTLQSFKIAVSPTREVVVFAKSTWLLICGSKWDGAKIKYSPNWQGHVNCKAGEEITTIFLLPFVSQSHSSLGCADWTCIILGFSSGCIKFFTEGMQELAYSILHEEKILDIKCFSPVNLSQGKYKMQENVDIYVLYKTVICILNKSQLLQILQNKRNELTTHLSVNKNEAKSYLSVDFKKYSFAGQEVTDACFLGQSLVSSFNTFDHLITASLVGGFNSNYRASPPQTSLIVTTGKKPFVGFYYTLEGANTPVLSDVALAVASKIKNSVTATLPNWFSFGNKKSAESDKPKEVSQDYAEKLSCRFGLYDLWREGQSIVVSPDGIFSAITDSLGRVILVDNISGVAHHLWKGYRDAQCGFIQVSEDIRVLKKDKENTSKPQPRQGLFMVIYAPKKGIIEIFTTQQGRRVTSFKVTKYGRLLYFPGVSDYSNISSARFNLGQNQVIFVSEEGFKEFSMPFHCALAEENSKISRDLIVLKKMKILLKMESNSTSLKLLEDIEKCARELKTDEIRLQAIESMIGYKNVTLEAFKSVLIIFLETLQNKERTKGAPKKIIQFAELLLNLLLFYEFIISWDLTPNADNELDKTRNSNSFFEELRLTQGELDVILKFVEQVKEIEELKYQTTKVAFEDKTSTKLVKYLSCFDFESFLSVLNKNEKQEEEKESYVCVLNLKSGEKESIFCYLGEIVFSSVFKSFSVFNQWKKYIKKCCFNPKDLAFCLISYWCNQKIVDDIFPEVHIFVEVLKFISGLNDPYIVTVEYNNESPWWRELRNCISGNTFAIRGLFAALCCRSVTIFMEQEREFMFKHTSDKNPAVKSKEDFSGNEKSTFSNDWETISKDSCQWDILITQLQDIALLNAVLKLTFKTQSSLSKIPFDFEPQCLTLIQAKGTGQISELVAKWLVQFGFEPSALVDSNDVEFQESGIGSKVEKEESELIVATPKTNETTTSNETLKYLALLKSRFPYSLTSSSLLCNLCWEYFAHWSKNIGDIEFLESAIQCLKAIPACQIKYGISHLSWSIFLEQKFETLAIMINRIGKVPRDKLCAQEIGLKNDQVPVFLKLIIEVLKLRNIELDEKSDFGTDREVIWQNSSTTSTSNLVSIALSQPIVNGDLILFHLQLSMSLLLMSSLNIKQQRVFSSLFDNVEGSNFTQTQNSHLTSHFQNLKLKNSRTEFLKKCLTATVQTVEIVEYIPPVSSDKFLDILPTTRLKTENYQKWLQLCFELAGIWAVSMDDLRKHQICELYFCGFDRLAEEVMSSVNDTHVLGSQLLVLGGKRLKYLIQDSENLSKKMTQISANLSEWLLTLDLENFSYHGTVDDVEVLMRYTATLLPEGHSNQKLAVAIIESLSFLKTTSS